MRQDEGFTSLEDSVSALRSLVADDRVFRLGIIQWAQRVHESSWPEDRARAGSRETDLLVEYAEDVSYRYEPSALRRALVDDVPICSPAEAKALAAELLAKLSNLSPRLVPHNKPNEPDENT